MVCVKSFNLCKTYNFTIGNGRMFNDVNDQAFTFTGQNGNNEIDYLVLSNETLDTIGGFETGVRSESSHMPIVFTLKN